MNSKEPGTAPFPSEGLLPKSETRADKFVSKNPSYDGRGVVVAIMDTGVDPGAIGLQVTSDGRPKVIDIVDTTGGGDVDVSTERVVEEGCSTITGLTGRELKLNPAWTNPSRKYYVGIKRGYELFPGGLKKRLVSERTRDWEEQQRHAEAVLQRQLADLNKDEAGKKKDLELLLTQLTETGKSFEDPGPLYDCVVFHDGNRWQAVIDVEESGDLSTKEPMTDYRIGRQYSNFGPYAQLNYCVNIYDPTAPRSPYAEAVAAAMEASSGGKKADGEAPAAAAATPGKGLVLSIVTDAGSHGSHVAGIVAAHHEGRKDASGVAPGAQIVAVKIGDSRLGSMETGVGMVRGLLAVLEAGAHIINLSYGESCESPDVGRVIEVAAEVTRRFGVIFVSSAGNNGPALTTVGAPGGTSSSIIGVGAFVSPSMKAVSYSYLPDANTPPPPPGGGGGETTPPTPSEGSSTPSPGVTSGGGVTAGAAAVTASPATVTTPCGINYTWSSRGPAADGHRGVCISAPGGAIAPVPNWTLAKGQLMNGTSMSSPNAAGCVALILSGLLQRGVAYSPHHVRRALENTAVTANGEDGTHADPFALGCGMVQVDGAFDWLCTHEGAVEREVWFDTTLPSITANGRAMRGVYLRTHEEMESRSVLQVSVAPGFKEGLTSASADDADVDSANRTKVEFEMRLALRSTAPGWLECPDHLLLMSNGRTFPIGVDPRGLPSGAHFAEVLAYDADAPERGPVFRFPVTVVKPLVVPSTPPSSCSSSVASVSGGDTDAAAAAAAAVGADTPTGEGQAVLRFAQESLGPGQISRKFIQVPPGATWANINLTRVAAVGEQTTRLVVLHTVQLLPHRAYEYREKHQYLRLAAGKQESVRVKVKAGVTMELCVAQSWNQPGATSLGVEVDFHSLVPSTRVLTLTGGRVYDRLTLTAALAAEKIQPEFKLTTWTQMVRPASSEVTLLPPRDSLPGARHCYQLVLTYKFEQAEAGEVTPRVPALNEALYDSALESQMLLLLDSRKRLWGVSDCHPEKMKLAKGSYEVRLQLRHHLPSLLNRFNGLQLQLRRSIASAVTLSAYKHQYGAMTGGAGRWGEGSGGTFGLKLLRRGESVAVFVAEPDAEKIPKGASAGDILSGSMKFSKAEGRPGGFPLKYVVPVAAPAAAAADAGSKKKEEKKKKKGVEAQEIADAIRDIKVSHLEAVSGTPAFTAFHTTLMEEYGEGSAAAAAEKKPYMPLLLAGLRHALACATKSSSSSSKDGSDGAAPAPADAATSDAAPAPAAAAATPAAGDLWLAVVTAADAVVSAVDATATAAELGLRAPEDEEEEKGEGGEVEARQEARKKAEGNRDALVESLSLRCLALLHVARLEAATPAAAAAAAADAEAAAAAWAKFKAAYAEAGKWSDLGEDKYCALSLAKDEKADRTGAVVKRLRKLISAGTDTSNGGKNPCGLDQATLRTQLGEIVAQLGWSHVGEYEKKWGLLRDPVDYPLF